jgi:hypothetical protein
MQQYGGAGNGIYWALPGGFIIQMGYVGSTGGVYNFPIAFPNGVVQMVVGNADQQGAAVDNAYGYALNGAGFFAATRQSNTPNAVTNFPISYIAMGW